MRASKSNIFLSIVVIRSRTKARNCQNCTSHSKHVEGHKPHCDNCSSEKIACNLCFTILLGREDEGIKKCVSLKALRILDRMDVETALEVHRKGVKNSIPDEKVSTTLVPELESKRWKKNGLSLLSYPVGLTFSPKHSR